MFQCVHCGAEYEQKSVQCSTCGRSYGVIYVPDLPGTGPIADPSVVSAIEVLKEQTNYKAITGFEFMGQVAERFSVLLYGTPGSGKSSFALRFANQLAKEGGDALYFAQEEGLHSATLKKKLLDYKIDAPNLYLSSVDNFSEIFSLVRGKRTVVIDSLTEMKAAPAMLKSLIDRVARTVIIVHATKTKIYKGNSSLAHLVDVILQADGGVVRTETKNRFGEVGKEFRIFPEKGDGDKKE